MQYTDIKRTFIKTAVFTALILFCPVLSSGEISFSEEEPDSLWRYGDIVDCYITAVSTTAGIIDNDSVQYRVSSSGLDEFSIWNSDAVLKSSDSFKSRFHIGIPNDAGDRFAAGEANYIKWRVEKKNESEGYFTSDPYNIKIRPNFEPVLEIIQPAGTAGLNPVMEVSVLDYALGIDTDSIEMEVKDDSGKEIISVKGEEMPDIYDSFSETIYYSGEKPVFTAGREYEFTVTVSDSGYVEAKTAVLNSVFTAKGGVISDFVSYPSPFDNRRGVTTFRYVLEEEAQVTINIYNTAHNLVKTVVKNTSRSAGMNEDTWDGRDFSGEYASNGIYFCEIIASGVSVYKRYTATAIHSEK